MTTIIHAADIHLGAIPMGKRDLGRDISHFVYWLSRQIRKTSANLVILAGDTFDSPVVTPTDLIPILHLIRTAEKHGCKIAIVDGNHDSMKYSKSGNKKNQDTRTWSECLRVGFPDTVMKSFSYDEAIEKKYHLQEVSPGGVTVLPLDFAPGPHIREILGQVRYSPEIHPDILICHQSASWATGGIFETELDDDSVDGIATYVAMGDIHKMAVRRRGKSTIAYSGPSTWIKENESGNEGAWLITIDETADDADKLTMVRICPEATRHIVEIEIRGSDDGGYRLITTPSFVGSMGIFDSESYRIANADYTRIGCEMFGIFSVTDQLEEQPQTFECFDKILLRVLYPHDSEIVNRRKAVEFGEELIRTSKDREGLTERCSIVVADPVDGKDVSSKTDMSSWVRNTNDEEGTFTDDIVMMAIEASSLEITADDEFASQISDLAKQAWVNPGSIESTLKNI